MMLISKIFIALIALEHCLIAGVEIFAWTSMGPKMFPHLDADFIRNSKSMAANQGIYNIFLAAGLVWALFATASFGFSLAVFFLSCVIIAGVFGAITASKSILFKQALPAAVAMAVVLFAR